LTYGTGLSRSPDLEKDGLSSGKGWRHCLLPGDVVDELLSTAS